MTRAISGSCLGRCSLVSRLGRLRWPRISQSEEGSKEPEPGLCYSSHLQDLMGWGLFVTQTTHPFIHFYNVYESSEDV